MIAPDTARPPKGEGVRLTPIAGFPPPLVASLPYRPFQVSACFS